MLRRRTTLTILAVLLFARPALPQEGRTDTVGPTASSMPAAPEVFGSANNLLQIPAAAFTPRNSATTYTNDGLGYLYATGGPVGTPFWAPVQLPAGVVIDRIGFYSYDNDPDDSIQVRLQGYTGAISPSSVNIATVSTLPGVPEYNYATAALNHQVFNAAAGGGYHYMVLIDIPDVSSLLRFKAVELRWHRVVSPEPGVATYPGDVPTSHPYFRFVEALAAAQITGGCGPGIFCPDQAVTRGQMAVFLAVALGLHFAN